MLNINFETPHFTADQSLLDHITAKLSKAEHYFDNIQSADVYLKLENTGQVKDKIVELKLRVPGKVLLATGRDKSFEAAFDEASSGLKRQILKYKEKIRETNQTQTPVNTSILKEELNISKKNMQQFLFVLKSAIFASLLKKSGKVEKIKEHSNM